MTAIARQAGFPTRAARARLRRCLRQPAGDAAGPWAASPGPVAARRTSRASPRPACRPSGSSSGSTPTCPRWRTWRWAWRRAPTSSSMTCSAISPAGRWPGGLIFVNGHLAHDLSHAGGLPDGVVIKGIDELLRDEPERLLAGLGEPTESHSLAELNAAFLASGAWIEVPDDVALERPIQLLFLTAGETSAVMTHPRIVLRLGQRSSAHLIESHVGVRDGHCLTNLVADYDHRRRGEAGARPPAAGCVWNKLRRAQPHSCRCPSRAEADTGHARW